MQRTDQLPSHLRQGQRGPSGSAGPPVERAWDPTACNPASHRLRDRIPALTRQCAFLVPAGPFSHGRPTPGFWYASADTAMEPQILQSSYY